MKTLIKRYVVEYFWNKIKTTKVGFLIALLFKRIQLLPTDAHITNQTAQFILFMRFTYTIK